jgi:hypothetical protein
MQPKTPNKIPYDAPACDPQLPKLALEYRREHQLMTQAAFSAYNVSVWRLQTKTGLEYVSAHNRTIAELEKAHGPRDTKVGLHAEQLAAAKIVWRRDVLSGQTLITQIFTERTPCSECHQFLWGIPLARYVPRYFYLNYSDREWQKNQADGRWGLFLMDCYRLRT